MAVGLRPLPSLATYTKGRRGNVQSLPAEGGARPWRRLQLGLHAGCRGQRPRPGTGRKASKGGGGRKKRRNAWHRHREARGPPASRGVPTPPPRGPREREGQRLRLRDWIQGRCVFGFPHVLPSPSPHLDVSRLPGPWLSRQGPSRGLRSAFPLPFLPRAGGDQGSPAPRPLRLRGPGRASPGQGWAGGGDAQGARERGRR